MKKLVTVAFFCVVAFTSLAQNRYWIATTTSNWNNTANWSAASGGAAGASVPTTGNLVIFNGTGGRNGNCLVDVTPTVAGITVNGYTGTIDLLGNTITTTAANTFATGTINNTGVSGSMALNNTTVATTFSGTAINANVTGTTGNLLFNGSAFGGTVNVTKANTGGDTGTGNNTFTGAVTLTNSSTSTLLLGNTNKDVFNSTLTININNTGAVSIAAGGATAHQLNGNVSINYNSTGAVIFGNNNGPSSLASGKTITVVSVGAAGAGNLTLSQFTASSTAQTLSLPGNTTATLTVGPLSNFAGALTATAPSLLFRTTAVSGTTQLNKTGPGTDNLYGGNTFTTTTATNSGAGEMNFANTAADIFNGNTILNNTGSGRIQVGISSAGNTFNGNLTISHGGSTPNLNCILSRNSGSSVTVNGNLILNQTNTDTSSGTIISLDGAVTVNGNITLTCTNGRGILFGGDQSTSLGTVTLANGFTIRDAGAGTYNTALLQFQHFTQVGSTPQAITLTGTTQLIISTGTVWNGDVNFVSPSVYLHGATYNSTAYIEKNGPANNTGNGGNTFAGSTTLVNSGSGYLLTANSNFDTFNGNLTVTNTGSDIIYLAHNVTGTQFNGNISLNCTTGSGIYFSSNNTGSSTMASGKALSIGASGFASGQLRLSRFTQNGTTATNMTFTGSSLAQLGPSTTFGGNVTIVAPQLLLHGATYNGTSYLEKNGVGDNAGNGGNVFNAAATLVESNSGYLMTGNITGDTFNGDLTVTNNGSNWIYLAHNSTGNAFNGNVTVNCTTGNGIIISNSGGSATMASGKTFFIGSAGFTTGEFRIRRLTQNGTTPVSLVETGTGSFRVGPSTTFGGAVNVVSPQVYLDGATFNSTAYIEKNGATDNAGNGGNVFNAPSTIADSGSGAIYSANTTADTFNDDITFTNSGGNWIFMAHNVPGTVFNGNIYVNSTAGNGIMLSSNTSGFSSQASGKTIFVGASGFTVGELRVKRFTQNGTTPVNLTFTGVASLRVGPSTTFGGTVNFLSPQIYLDGATFSAAAIIEKNGPTDNAGIGGNVFNSTAKITDSGPNYLLTGNTSPDIFNDDLTLVNTGSAIIYMAYNAPGTQFNGNVIVNETSGTGIWFSNGGSGSATLASGKTISVGAQNFLVGELRLARFTQAGSTTPQALTLAGTANLRLGPSSTFGSNVNFVTPNLYLDGTTFNGTTYLEKNGAGGNSSNGNSTFNGVTTIVNSGSNAMRTNGGNTFNAATTLLASGSNDLLLENTTGSTYNGDVTFTNTGSSYVRVAYAGDTFFNGNMIFNSTSGTGVYFCENGTSTATLASGKTVSIGGLGFSNGELRLARFTQLGSTAQALTLTNVGSLRLGPTSVFNGQVNFKSPQLYMDGTTFNGVTSLEKNGSTGDQGIGNNVFATTATIINSGSGNLRTNGNNTFNGTTTLTSSGSNDLLLELNTGSIYNGDLIINNTGSQNVRMSFNGTTAYNGNITVNSTSGLGIVFGEAATSSSTLANGKTITTGGAGFTTGQLVLQRFTQIGGTAQALTLTGSSLLQVGPSATFNGNVNFRAPQLALNGGTYNGTTFLEKTGGTNNDSAGNNVFNGVTTITASGSGWIRTARTATDQFNNDLTVTNTGTSSIYLSDLVAGSTYNGNIVVNSNLSQGIYFGFSNGSSTLAPGKTITVGATGFNFGELRLQNFTQSGATAQTLALTGTADLRVGPASTFNGNVDFRAPQLFLDGATYNGSAYLEKNGATNNTGIGNNIFAGTASIVISNSGFLRTNGNNTFNGATTLLNSGTNDLLLELVTGSSYNGDVTMTNTGPSYVRAAYIGTNNFNGNIIVNSTNATGVYFCENALGAATLANGKTISVGGIGFTAGELRLQRFIQTGTTAQTLTLTGSASFRSGPAATWNGNVTVTSPQLFLDGAVFNAAGSFTKTGTTLDASAGGNTFNGAAVFTNNNSGTFRLANSTGDAFNGAASFVQTSGIISPAYAGSSSSAGNITVTSTTPIVFGSNGGTVTFNASANQTINKGGAASPVFQRLIMGKTAGNATLNTDINIGVSATFTTGIIVSSATNFINFVNNATTSGASNASFVDGPVRKTGNQSFMFPIGNGSVYRSLAMTNPAATTEVFTAQYFKSAQSLGGPSTYSPGIITVSSCEYWSFNRSTGSTNVNITLSWNSPDCTGAYISDLSKLRVVRWNVPTTKWVDQGNGGTTGNAVAGTINNGTTVSAYGFFTLGSTTVSNPLPIELMSFTAETEDQNVRLKWVTASELNNDYFDLLRSADAAEFVKVGTVNGAGTKATETRYAYLDLAPGSGVFYYRLKQTDINGKSSFSGTVKVNTGEVTTLAGYPNPIQSSNAVTLNYTGYYEVINSLGIRVATTGKTNSIDTTSMPAGVYILRSDNGLTLRLVVE